MESGNAPSPFTFFWDPGPRQPARPAKDDAFWAKRAREEEQ